MSSQLAGAKFSPAKGSTSSSSSSTATLCMICSRVSTTRKPLFFRTTTPSIPAKAPDRMRANCPTHNRGCGSIRCSFNPVRKASIAASGSGAGTPARSSHNCKGSGDAQDADALENARCGQRGSWGTTAIQRHPGPIAPLPIRAIEREIVLNFALTQVLRNPLFVTTGGINRKPAQAPVTFGQSVQGISSRTSSNICSSQGFAILTWVMVYSKSTNRSPKQQFENFE